MNQNVTIVIVDDDEVDVMDIQDSLKRKKIGNHSVVASDGVEALELLQAKGKDITVHPPFLILLDINMPRMGGLEFLEQLREDPRLKSSIVFMLTTSDNDQDRFQAYKHNVAGYLLKDQTGEELLKKLQLIEDYLLYVRFPVDHL